MLFYKDSPERQDKALELSGRPAELIDSIPSADLEHVVGLLGANHRNTLIALGKSAERIQGQTGN